MQTQLTKEGDVDIIRLLGSFGYVFVILIKLSGAEAQGS